MFWPRGCFFTGASAQRICLKNDFVVPKKKASEIERKETCGYRISRERKRASKESTSSFICICILDVHIANLEVENGATYCTFFLLC